MIELGLDFCGGFAVGFFEARRVDDDGSTSQFSVLGHVLVVNLP